MSYTFSKQQIAVVVAVIFHAVGLAGILVFKNDWIIKSTPINLLLSVALLIWTQEDRNIFFWFFMLATMVVGFVVEVIGVNTGLLFGNYRYGDVLGVKWKEVPVIIGVNWFIVVFCAGVSVTALLNSITKPIANTPSAPSPVFKTISVITDGATLAVAFDWLIEPVAIKLGYWQWESKEVPMYNYACWFLISLLLMTLFRFLPFSKQNKFAIHLFLIQVMFFLILRSFL